jgi:type II secretory pathway pseudopilin PulG
VKFQISNFKLRIHPSSAGDSSVSQIANRRSQIENSPAFSLIEVLIVVSLMSLIVLALMAVFSSTQRAFRAAVTQTDVLEGSRAAVDLMASDLRGLTPSDNYSNGAVNFSTLANYNNYSPLLQSMPGAITGVQRTNLLNYFFVLSRENTKWIGIGYVVDNTNTSNLYPLYRYYRDDLNVQSDPLFLFSDFTGIVNSGQWANTNMSHLMDGVVHLTVRGYDPNGRWINNFYQPYTNAATTEFFNVPASYGEAQFYMFSNTVPASVELELGVIEDSTLQRAESLPTSALRAQYLSDKSGVVHLFRQRVNIPNVDPTAYQ